MLQRKKSFCSYLFVILIMITTIYSIVGLSMAYAEDNILYFENFNTVSNNSLNGWKLPKNAKYLNFNTYNKENINTPENVGGIALNANATGTGNRSAYIDIDPKIISTDEQIDYEVFNFDLYMAGAVNTCNIFTMGCNQNDSYTDLSNTFFALGNGDGVGARNTLRYFNYDTNSWVSIPGVNEEWLNVTVYVNFENKKMAFKILDFSGNSIGSYGPFSFSSNWTTNEQYFNRIVMSAFRTSGGIITLDTWLDNFQVSIMSAEEIDYLNYRGILPSGTLNEDYTLIKENGDMVLKMNTYSEISDSISDVDLVRVISTDIKITELPTSGYQRIFSFNNDSNGNIMIDKHGNLFSQINSNVYDRILDIDEQIQVNQWYTLKCYVFLTTQSTPSYYTFEISGDFGNGTITVDHSLETRNSDNFKKLTLQLGEKSSNTVTDSTLLYKNIFIEASSRPSIRFQYNNGSLEIHDIYGNLEADELAIENGSIIENTIPTKIKLIPNTEYYLYTITLNDVDVTCEISNDFIDGGCNYLVPLKDYDVVVNVEFSNTESRMITTKEPEPYELDPLASWDVRKFASEKRTLRIGNNKMAYRLYKPVGYDQNSTKKYPLVVSLRAKGEGNTGFDNAPYTAGHIEDILTSGQNAEDFPCFILSPQCYNDTWADNDYINVSMALKITHLLIDEIDNIDEDRIYIGGLSDGGFATWLSVALEPDLFAAAFPMSGLSANLDLASKFVNTPIWTFYALDDSDNRIVLSNKNMMNSINSLGGKVICTEYMTGGHIISWKEGLQSPLFQWLFSHEKGSNTPNDYVNGLINDYNDSLIVDLKIPYSFNQEIDNSNVKIQETVLGDIVTDAIKQYTNADIAFINSSDLGETIPAGIVNEEHILNALPIKLKPSIVEISGLDIYRLMTNALTYYPNQDGRFLQVSGLEISFDPELRPSQRIQEILVNGEELDKNKIYRVAVTDHLISNNLNYTYNEGLLYVKERYYQTIQQMFVNYLNENNYNLLNIKNNRINAI